MFYSTVLILCELVLVTSKECSNSENCAAGDNCLDIKVSNTPKEVCTKCAATHVPINGACQAKDGQSAVCTPPGVADGTCQSCKGENYLYEGGCYTACPQGAPNPETNTCDGVPAPDCNIPNCEACSEDKKTCTTCQPGHLLTPEKNACLGACPAGSYAAGQACTPCDPSCAECSGAGASRCTACPAGKMLRYADEGRPADGTCAEGCVEGPECEACGLTIGGTKYCSKCAADRWAPRNGVCADTAAARSPFCTSASGGACTQCAGGYFLQEGGCYQTTRLPGKGVCAALTGDGKCQRCANGLAAVSGTCPLCDSTCATCTEPGQPGKCSACPPGRYLDAGNACRPCTEASGSIQGVAGCVSCAPPYPPSGAVTCYVKRGDSAGGSVNRGGLSTGAIAGIAVAVVVVVGGLVGFLCWWFLCRGKA
ncbi:VSP [Giardia lamblia P15]|uniref:VSP n=1 Tax=Giardia intestinalis (strain P15) TaxID=658858 RepID=E1F0P7_GIAIA|nr:VSP [Giardia lamblia P15]